MPEKTVEEKMIDVVRDNCRQIAHLRQISYADALQGHIDQCRENERDSRGVPREVTYWANMGNVARGELSRQLGMGRTPHPVVDTPPDPRLVLPLHPEGQSE